MPLQPNPSVGTTGGGLCDPGGGGTPGSDTSNGGTASSGCFVQRIQNEGVLVDCETVLNFIGTGVNAVDDPANDRINITISGGGGSANLQGDSLTSQIDGVATTFNLTETPTGQAVVNLLFNGLFQVPGVHFTLAADVITTNFTPLVGDTLYAIYPF